MILSPLAPSDQKSAKRQVHWERFAKLHGCTRMKFPKFNTTRWFSRMECVVVLCLNAHTLLLFLEENKRRWEKGRAVYKKLTSYRVLLLLFCLRDLLGPCEQLSKAFQADSLEPHQVFDEVESKKAELEKKARKPLEEKHVAAFRKQLKQGKWVVGGKMMMMLQVSLRTRKAPEPRRLSP